jgi:murein DD-endopeptidase MepM/ murein hydrolase activator NlpD
LDNTPTTGNDTGGAISVYTVQAGDSLSQIASSHNISVQTILWANDIKNPSTIKPGASLIILPVSGVRHTVTSGESLASIAAALGANADDIASFNGLASGAALSIGQVLIIPGGELPTTSSNTATKAATPAKSSSSASAKTTSSVKTTATKSSASIKTGGGLTDIQSNPYRGGSGAEIDGYYGNPVPGAIVTQGIHGWNGIDLGAPKGTPIYAAAAGTVIVSKVGGYNGGYGNYVVISHANGTQTLYSHLSIDDVSIGESVSKGEKIGGVGMTGDATGNHLHFEVRGARNPFADCAVMEACTPK